MFWAGNANFYYAVTLAFFFFAWNSNFYCALALAYVFFVLSRERQLLLRPYACIRDRASNDCLRSFNNFLFSFLAEYLFFYALLKSKSLSSFLEKVFWFFLRYWFWECILFFFLFPFWCSIRGVASCNARGQTHTVLHVSEPTLYTHCRPFEVRHSCYSLTCCPCHRCLLRKKR
jgi:hypothetical protein